MHGDWSSDGNGDKLGGREEVLKGTKNLRSPMNIDWGPGADVSLGYTQTYTACIWSENGKV